MMYEIGHLLTVPELADALSVKKKTVYDWVYKGAIPYSKLCAKTVFSQDKIEGLLESNRCDPSGVTVRGSTLEVELGRLNYRLNRILTVSQFADAIHVPERTVRDWVYRRTIPFTRLRRRVYFSTDVVEGLLQANSRPVGGRPGGSSESSDSQREGGALCEEDSNGQG
ncbi:MAG: helix-turn-helix domain-containing protein [Planctomycetota bacterium]|jgi:excisionase family DNA binding protein